MNARSVCNKADAIRDLIVENSVHILCISETWLSKSDSPVIADLLPDTHNLFHNPRAEGRGGGVAVIITKQIKQVNSFRRKFNSFECIQVWFSHRGKNIALFCIYRAPGPKNVFLNEFEEFLLESQTSSNECIYVGDFNLWIDDFNNVDAMKFLDLLVDFNLINHINCATYDSGHILDLLIARKDSSSVKSVEVEPVCTLSDHRIISFRINVPFIAKYDKIIKFRKKDSNLSTKFRESLVHLVDNIATNCAHFNNANCVDCLNASFRNAAESNYKKYAPLIEKNIKITDISNFWFNSEVKEAKRKLRQAEKLYVRHKCEYTRSEFIRLRREKDNKIQCAKTNYLKERIKSCGSDSKKLNNELNYILGRKIKTDNQLPIFENKEQLANDFKNFFIAKIDQINSTFQPCDVPPISNIPDYPVKSFNEFSPVSTEQVANFITNTKKTYCMNDPIDMRAVDIVVAGDAIQEVLCEIINASFQSGNFPKQEKFSYVRPLLKANKNSDELSSYRPLYNTSFLAKILENAALEQLKTHLNSFQYFSKFQSAYRKHHSVETAVCKIYNDLVLRKAAGECAILILIDQSAAFDTVDHEVLLRDLHLAGVGGRVLGWFRSYLSNRSFRVVIDECVSEEGVMPTGVPQGSVMGPILFSIYTTELGHILESLGVSYHFYADDTQIYFELGSVTDDMHKIENTLATIKEWMNSKKLKINPEKTEVMIIGSQLHLDRCNRADSFVLHGSRIELSKKVRSLGVIVDQTLTLREHLRYMKGKLINNLINIARVTKYLDRGSRMHLVHNLILSNTDFCNSIYYGLPDCDLRILQLVINSAARLVVGMPRFSREHITPVCIDLHILPVKARIKYKICLLTHKALKFGEPAYLADLLHRRNALPSLRDSSVKTLEEPLHSRLASADRCFAHCAPKLYNTLPADLVNTDSLICFKKKLKTFIFLEAYDLENKCVNDSFKL